MDNNKKNFGGTSLPPISKWFCFYSDTKRLVQLSLPWQRKRWIPIQLSELLWCRHLYPWGHRCLPWAGSTHRQPCRRIRWRCSAGEGRDELRAWVVRRKSVSKTSRLCRTLRWCRSRGWRRPRSRRIWRRILWPPRCRIELTFDVMSWGENWCIVISTYIDIYLHWHLPTLMSTYIGIYLFWYRPTLTSTYIDIYLHWCLNTLTSLNWNLPTRI